MKKNHIFYNTCLLAAIIITIGCYGNVANKGKSTTDSITAQEITKTNHKIIFRTDSFKLATHSKNGSCDIYLDYPMEGPEKAVSAIRDFIKSTLFDDGGLTFSDNPELLMQKYCEECQEKQRKMLEQMGINNVSTDYAPEEGIDIRTVCITPKFITYEIYRYSYITHGAHGEYSNYGVTFSMKDGHRFSEDLISHVDEGLYIHIREGMKKYFGIRSDEELEAICTTDLSLYPMPTFPPYLLKKGVCFHYSIYDLCPFEYGDPMITIPYSVALPYMTEKARELLTE